MLVGQACHRLTTKSCLLMNVDVKACGFGGKARRIAKRLVHVSMTESLFDSDLIESCIDEFSLRPETSPHTPRVPAITKRPSLERVC